LASFGEVAESFEERKLIALEAIAGAARLWTVSRVRSLDTTSSADFLSSISINRTRRRGLMRGKRMTRKIKETKRCRFPGYCLDDQQT
jgi:hypothetical protein